ncbi:MAG: hypothetical protein COT34_02180 [Candidatus Nealsonbacteria bacterium CG08_land_8_20_14_0_20_43_11]|uniref:Adenylate kinase n=1 Tax=Candidatus Nealsonbacteria bacterium CG08_land_8_20_14_0_20_43_11 TaxID=1974706 RepID=A0A2M6T061_9BACT|nr:MAG: hypothetical protein COT34_02180 [Candidatus Nealsonbacteria bacterium CG08_land_8_20_14_0_20_43_11]
MKKENKQEVIIILGAPGSGKGTQAELLAESRNLYYFETSKLLEQKFQQAKKGEAITIKGKRYDLLEERKLWETGILCTPAFVFHLVKTKIIELFEQRKNLVIAGSPRTLEEGKNLIPLLRRLYGDKNIKVIVLEIGAKATIWRNTHRRICELMRHPIVYSKENAKLRYCPLDGSRLVARKGLDTPQSIKVRLKEYRERTYPLIDFFKEKEITVKKINGEKSVEAVYKDVLKALR